VTDLLRKRNIAVLDENDIVIFKVGRATARFSYRTAFKLAQRLRLHAKLAARIAGEDFRVHRIVTENSLKHLVKRLSTVQRASRERPNLNYEIGNEGSLVVFRMGNVFLKFDHETAMTIAAWIREHGKSAKAWAGDTGKSFSIVGRLSDAEDNAKRFG
jgi:hypothetical protein